MSIKIIEWRVRKNRNFFRHHYFMSIVIYKLFETNYTLL
jgi:hypothetical protein